MIDVRCICAIGQRGQLGLNGQLPWEGNTDPLFVEDVTRFFALTMGHVLIAGPKTVASVPAFAFKDRTIDVIRSHEDPEAVWRAIPAAASSSAAASRSGTSTPSTSRTGTSPACPTTARPIAGSTRLGWSEGRCARG